MKSINYSPQQGFTLVEVLIAFVILSFGLLGAVALQAKAKQASFDSMQRAAAVALGNDMIQRMRANDRVGVITQYNGTFTSNTALEQSRTCYTDTCSSAEIAALDRQQWIRAIQARENTGALDDATVCIENTAVAGGDGKAFNIQVVVSWQGRQEITASADTKAISCGEASNTRRVMVLKSYIYLRS
ncbi:MULTISPECIES: type IV pilus modification protein PilV [Pseudoalteromonas]|uniref:type IV pilus modification protein PilV n=1 Tax=Pseudoalteromonas TaxID=53246 RepID=UPI0002DDAD9B|nr:MULTISPECIES: type IV pilus modification protein PilV [Pseudoalteromonas]MCF6143608.1 type IV pilus assembly protein PilV [Pseudoalteromonas mariniglutinosa NCIMB 1770]